MTHDSQPVKSASLRNSYAMITTDTSPMDLSFILKKIASTFLTPLSIGLETIALGFFLLAIASWRRRKTQTPSCGKRRTRIGTVLLVTGSIFLYFCSLSPVSDALLSHLEKQHPPLLKKDGKIDINFKPECIVLLAGGGLPSRGVSAISHLSGPTLGRLAEAAILWKEFPDADFIMTGNIIEIENMAIAAAEMGVNPDKIIRENESRDTKDHPIRLKPIIADKPFLLVTSASHMPRSMKLFQKQGYKPVAAPANFRSKDEEDKQKFHRVAMDSIFPSINNLQNTHIAMHEYIGLIWGTLRGQI